MYCPNCGSPNAYSGTKPKFCTSCGNKFISQEENKASSVTKRKPSPEPPPKSVYQPKENVNAANDLDDDDEDIAFGEMPQIDHLDFELSDIERPKKDKLGNIACTVSNETVNSWNSSFVSENLTPEQALEQFKDQAKSLRNKE